MIEDPVDRPYILKTLNSTQTKSELMEYYSYYLGGSSRVIEDPVDRPYILKTLLSQNSWNSTHNL